MNFVTSPRVFKASDVLDEIGKRLVEEIRGNLAKNNINASGSLSDSLYYTVRDFGVEVYANDYFVYAETGRKAGRIPKNFGDILKKWVEDKGISVPSQFKSTRQFGYAIASKIAKYGSARKRNNNPIDLIGDAVTKVADEFEDELAGAYVETINDGLNI